MEKNVFLISGGTRIFFSGAAKTAIIHKLNKKNYIVYKNLIIIKTNYIL
jgi:hypothetical protein